MNDQPATDLAVSDRIDRFLHAHDLAASGTRVVALAGDASDRRYVRVLPPDGRSIVLAVHTSAIDFASLPFAHVARLFEEMPLPVPAILAHSDALGILALEDLGDATLQGRLATATPAERGALYRQAVSLIDRLQRRGAELTSSGAGPYGLAFDVEKLTFELRFFVTHFIEAYRGVALGENERVALDAEWREIAEELAADPRVLCHRDYHSRNLMWRGGRLHIIDFQDARMGPDTYDLASLLRDSYVDIPDREVDELIAYFLSLAPRSPAAEFRRRFDLMSLQRNLKALGTFGYQATARGNAAYVESMPRTLRYARANLEKYPRFGRLLELLAGHIDELG